MKIMRTVAALTVFSIAPALAAEGWLTDFDAAFAKAKREKKAVLIEFTGSDWCKPCIEMQKKVFSKKDFLARASADFVLLKLDFPNNNPAVKKKNAPYAEKYKISVFPTVVLLDANRKEFHRFTASDYPSTSTFLKHLKTSLKRK